ncbi:MAG: MurR/RpiR family transcriptional regulator [Hoeflea sp.]|nr:MurR/RpiR family transcriptional regulator [Hoeflea sp.]
MEDMMERLTPAERQLKSVLMADYPFAGLEPIQELSRKARISAPSISRFVNKLGFAGFQEFQQTLVQELKQGNRSPIDLRENQVTGQEASLAAYLQRVEALNAELSERVSPAQFDRICRLLGDPKRRIYMIGGRMSDSIAGFFVRHLSQIRKDVHHIPSDPELWPEYVLRLRPKDIVLVIDFRRYQANLERLSVQVRNAKAQTIVITDQWISPCAKGASELISVPIDSGTLWDSYVPAFALVEALLIPLAEMDWNATKARIAQWDSLRDEPKDGIGE